MATVNIDACTGDVTRRIGRGRNDDGGNFIGLTEAARGHIGTQFIVMLHKRQPCNLGAALLLP